FYRKGLLFAFNFNPVQSFTDVRIPVPANADYEVKLSSDDEQYGGQNRIEHMVYPVQEEDGTYSISLYLPARTAVVLKEGRIRKAKFEGTAK
ncbi:MAG: alpha amylase C-terminal domain-containing protein, partial [Firmicutes bacterium]|nr:alpha amylase C-terminal domain-containing protein [Bacillota bacterium]